MVVEGFIGLVGDVDGRSVGGTGGGIIVDRRGGDVDSASIIYLRFCWSSHLPAC